MRTQSEFFSAIVNGNKWGVPVTISRSGSADGGLPLDTYSIFKSKAEADIYASLDKTRVEAAGFVNNGYIGQIVTVWESNDKVDIYYIDSDKTLKPIGVIPVGDDKTIAVDNGSIALVGAKDATGLTYPRMKSDKSGLEWVGINEIVQNAENTVTTGDGKSIVTEATEGNNNSLIAKIKNYNEASAGQVPFKDDSSGIAWKSVYTSDEINNLIKGIFTFKGIADHLSATGDLYKAEEEIPENIILGTDGDVYHVNKTKGEVVYVSDSDSSNARWLELGSLYDANLSAYATEAHLKAAVDKLDGELKDHIKNGVAKDLSDLIDSLPENVEDNAEKNIIEIVKVDGEPLDVDSTDRSVNIVLPTASSLGVYTTGQVDGLISGLKTNEIAAAQGKADSAYRLAESADGVSGSNASAIDVINKRLNGYNETIEGPDGEPAVVHRIGLEGRITNVEGTVDSLAGSFKSLSETVNGVHTGETTKQGLVDKVEQLISNSATKGSLAELADLLGKDKKVDDNGEITIQPTGAFKKIYDNKDLIDANILAIDANAKAITALQNRMKNEEDKEDKDTTYTFEDGTAGTFIVIPKGGTAQTVDTGAKAYTDEEIKKLTNTLYDSKDEDKAKSIRTIAADVLAEKLIPEGAQDSLDTLAEIAAWIQSHPGDVTEMNVQIQKNTNSLKALIGNPEEGQILGADGAIMQAIATATPATATNSKLGVVMGSTTSNKVYVESDGTMTVNKINVDKLEQTANTWLILNGGGANS